MSEVTRLIPLHQRPLHERVAATVRAEMARHSVRQREIAHALGLTQQSVSGKLRGSTPFALDELAVIAPMIHMSVADLVAQGEGPRPAGGLNEGQTERARRDSNPQPSDQEFDHLEEALATVHRITPRASSTPVAGGGEGAVVITLAGRRSAS